MSTADAARALELLRDLDQVLGVLPDAGRGPRARRCAPCSMRGSRRGPARDWAASDRLRDELLGHGHRGRGHARRPALATARWRSAVADRPPDDRRKGSGPRRDGPRHDGPRRDGPPGAGRPRAAGRWQAAGRTAARRASARPRIGVRPPARRRAAARCARFRRHPISRSARLRAAARRPGRTTGSLQAAGPHPAAQPAPRQPRPWRPAGCLATQGPQGPRGERGGSRFWPTDRFGPGPRPRPWEDRAGYARRRPAARRAAAIRRPRTRPAPGLQRPTGACARARPAASYGPRPGGPPGRRPYHGPPGGPEVDRPTPPMARCGSPLRSRSHSSPATAGRRDPSALPSPEALGPDEELVAGRRPVEEAFVARRPAIRLLVVPQRRAALEKLVLHATSLRIPIVEVEGGSLTALAGFDGHQGVALVVEPRQFATPGRRPRAGRRARRAAVHPRARLARGSPQRRHAPAQRRGRRRPRRRVPDPPPGAAQPVGGQGVGRRRSSTCCWPRSTTCPAP